MPGIKCEHDKRKDRCKNCKINNSIINSKSEDYDKMRYEDLLFLCRERKIKRYSEKKKENLIELLKENVSRKTLFDYISEENPTLFTKFVGNQNDLKTIPYGTNKKFTWKCDNIECSNTYEQSPYGIYRKDSPRKYCNNCSQENRYINKHIAIITRSGSILDKFPLIKDVWSNKNIKTPNDFSPGSNEEVKLKCPNNSAKHPDYKIVIGKIQEHNCFRCPKCITKSSNAEMRIYSELKYSFNNIKWQQKIEGREADVTIEDLKLVIEIDGFPWHKDKSEKDLEKNIIFENNGYSVLRIRDPRLDCIVSDTIVCNLTDLSLIDYNKIIEWINIKFKCNIVNYDEWKNTEFYKEIQSTIMYVKYEESIESLFPESKKLWDYEKNYPFLPSHFSKGSHVEMWLKCSKNHSWKRHISHLFRTIKNKNHIMKCPECHLPKSNKTNIEFNGKLYKSISECCRELNIDRNILYKMKGNNISEKIKEILTKTI